MPILVFLAVLGAALGHASWNALLKSEGKPWDNVTTLSYACAILSGIALFFVPAPAMASWPYMIASGSTQCFYMYMVSKVYKKGDYAVGYPLMRGLAPPFVALFGYIFLEEKLSLPELIGLLCISLGVLTIAFGSVHHMTSFKKQAVLAMLCGLCIAGYALIDGQGVRLSGSPAAYTMWVFVLQGIGIALFRPFKKHTVLLPMTHWKPWVAGAVAVGAYAIALWAMTLAPIAMVAALRESSIFFSSLIAIVVLKEKPSLFRVVGACMIAAGIITFRLPF